MMKTYKNLFGIEYDTSRQLSHEPARLRTHFFNQSQNSKFHWFFIEAVSAFECKLYIASALCVINGVEASLRVTLHQYKNHGIHKDLDKGQILKPRLLKEAQSIGIPVEYLRLPNEDKQQFENNLNSAKLTEIVKVRNDICHGNLSEYMTKIGKESAYFEPAALRDLALDLIETSVVWVAKLESWRLSNLEGLV